MATCPICKGDDVLKVSGIVERSKNVLGIARTYMGDILECPSKPRSLGCGTIALALLMVPTVCFPIFIWGLFTPIDHPFLQYVLFRFLVSVPAGIVVGIVVALLFLCFVKLARLSVYRRELSSWEEKMSRWNRSYYCVRDDIIFDSQTGDFAAPSEMENFLDSVTSRPEGVTEEEVEMARTKRFTKPAIVALILYFLVYPAGLIVNLVYMIKGRRMERIAGRSLPGVGLLKGLLWLNAFLAATWVVLFVSLTSVFVSR